MNKIYKNIGLILSALVLVLAACEKDYEAPTGEPNHVMAFTSFGNVPSITQVYEEITFIDLSRGVKNLEWSFPENAVIDSLDNYVTSSSESVVKVRFTEPGVYQIPLSYEFKGNVYVGEELKESALYDTTLTVTVNDSVKSDFIATRVIEGTQLVNADNAMNEVMAGRDVEFMFTGVGAPDTYKWEFIREDGFTVEYEDANITHKFSSMGNYTVRLVSSSAYSLDTLEFANYVKAIRSTDPVEMLSLKVMDKKKEIRLEFSRDMDNPFTCDPAAFDITVDNNGTDIPVSIAALKLDAVQNNIVIIQLAEDLFNSDVVSISYDQTVGDLATVDGMAVTSFTDASVIFINPNIIVDGDFDYGFEETEGSDWKYLWWGSPWDKYSFDVTENMAYTGKKSGYVQLEAGGGMIMGHKTPDNNFAMFDLKGGDKYIISCWVYVESLGDGATTPDLRFYWANSTDWSVGGCPFFDGAFPTGKWVYASTIVNSPGDGPNSFLIRGDNQWNSQACNFYVDEISISILEER